METVQSKVAVLDDDQVSSRNLTFKLEFVGEHPVVFGSEDRSKIIQANRHREIHAIVIGSISGKRVRGVLEFLDEQNIFLPVIIVNSQVAEDDLEDALGKQVVAFYDRSVHYEELLKSLNVARETQGLEKNAFNSAIASQTGTPLFRGLVGDSQAMVSLHSVLGQLKDKSVTILLEGEEGTGMEIVARNLHYISGRIKSEFIAVNCAALAENRALIDLLGSESVASGGRIRPGLFERGNGGTLFLENIDELQMDAQAALLDYLDKGAFVRVGGSTPVNIDTRIIVSTTCDLEECVKEGRFRKDLFYQLNVFPVRVPALRERTEDIPSLVQELSNRLNQKNRGEVIFDNAAIQSLQRHYWPGNLRELANLVERLSILKPNETITLDDLPSDYQHVPRTLAGERQGKPGDQGAPGDGNRNAEGSREEEKSIIHPDFRIPVAARLTDEALEDYLQRFERNLIEVAMDDSMNMEAYAAERLNITLVELQEKRHRLKL